MKGRSHRFPEPHDDWVDGSWTVDCVCGVNFDDGEEMVNCDECGVWVHTRCSRYVKGEELFTCDKCKNKNNKNDSEENEVAQLLVELPSKTLRMESSCAASVPVRRPFRLWTEIPMEERVHVQGAPGGDPALFRGLSSVFSQELWKSTGYVPKKFNFKYREFPSWDEDEKGEVKNSCENGHQADKGAAMLFSVSKENVLAAPVTGLVGVRGRDDEGAYDPKVGVKDTNRGECGEVMKRSQSGMKKEKSLICGVVAHSNKQKKEDFGSSKEWAKNAKAADKEADEKKGDSRSCKAGSRPISGLKLEAHEDSDLRSFKNDFQSIKNQKLKDAVIGESVDSNLAVNKSSQTSNGMTVALAKEMQLSDGCGLGKENDRPGCQVRIILKSSAANDAFALERKDTGSNHGSEERVGTRVDEGSVASAGKPPVCKDSTVQEFEKQAESVNGDISQSSVKCDEKQKETGDDCNRGVVGQQTLLPADAKDTGIASAQIPVMSEFNNAAGSSSLASEPKVQSLDRTSETVSGGDTGKAEELSSHPCPVKRESEDSEGSVSVQKDTSESKLASGLLQEPSKPCKPVPGIIASYSKRKVVVCSGKSSSSSSALEKSSSVDNFKHADSHNSNLCSKQQPMDSHASSEKDHASSDVVRDKDRGDDASRKGFKEHPKQHSPSKSLPHGWISNSSVSKRSVSDSKDSAPSSSSKASSAQNITGCGEATGLRQSASQSLNKQSYTGNLQRGEKPNQPNSQLSAKNSSQSTHPPLGPNSSATLSDEELALLLHQELNSSPRVPRVPRMRQPGSLPQLASPAATSLLIKHSSGSGGKDVFRRKNKDASKDGFRSSRDGDDKATKTNKAPFSPDRRRTQDRSSGSTKGDENENPRTLHSTRKLLPPSSTTSTSSGPCSSTEVNDHGMSSPQNSPRNTSDGIQVVHQTLPGLINEIMSKGKRMTYEELCNAVLPHWPHLRKHNGERYAYSSHSQAVLDCLRNRHEWARLVDRGPKTNSSRRKRKPGAEESDDDESSKGRGIEEGAGKSLESQREEFPKGKRKARKRRRLALQGRGIKDTRKRRKVELSDDDCPFSDSSEKSISSDDEVQGSDRGHNRGGEASASSEETETS